MDNISSFNQLLEAVEEVVEKLIANCENVRDLSTVGLDNRATYSGLYVDMVDESFVACRKGDDRVLQYYGGFEYIDKEQRREMGDFVFYMNSHDGECRVNEVFERLRVSKMSPEERERYEESRSVDEY